MSTVWTAEKYDRETERLMSHIEQIRDMLKSQPMSANERTKLNDLEFDLQQEFAWIVNNVTVASDGSADDDDDYAPYPTPGEGPMSYGG